jgi:hypothetical protein
MASGEFTYELSEQLHSVPKYVASRLAWKRGDGEDVFISQATVLTADGNGLDLSGYWQKNGRFNRARWGFSLKYMGHCVRSYDMALVHKNPGGGKSVGRTSTSFRHQGLTDSHISQIRLSPRTTQTKHYWNFLEKRISSCDLAIRTLCFPDRYDISARKLHKLLPIPDERVHRHVIAGKHLHH